jgi:hypothetical protein
MIKFIFATMAFALAGCGEYDAPIKEESLLAMKELIEAGKASDDARIAKACRTLIQKVSSKSEARALALEIRKRNLMPADEAASDDFIRDVGGKMYEACLHVVQQ